MSSAEENGGAGGAGGMEAMLGSVLETLTQNPELMELAGKLMGLSEMSDTGTADASETSENGGSEENALPAVDGSSPLAGLTALLGASGDRETGNSEKTAG